MENCQFIVDLPLQDGVQQIFQGVHLSISYIYGGFLGTQQWMIYK